jgi:hypothetical protein
MNQHTKHIEIRWENGVTTYPEDADDVLWQVEQFARFGTHTVHEVTTTRTTSEKEIH